MKGHFKNKIIPSIESEVPQFPNWSVSWSRSSSRRLRQSLRRSQMLKPELETVPGPRTDEARDRVRARTGVVKNHSINKTPIGSHYSDCKDISNSLNHRF